jgi:hypothetical protein
MDDVATLFFMGTGHEVGKQFPNEKTGESHHHLFTLMQRQLADDPQIKGGPGSADEPGGHGKIRGVGFGTGWQDNVSESIAWLEQRQQRRPPLRSVNLVGHSRGAVTCILLAHAMAEKAGLRPLQVNIFAIDPVPGGYTDFFTFSNASPFQLPSNVREYTSILMENAGDPFFACLSEGRNLRAMGDTNVTQYPLPGKHGDATKSDFAVYPAARISAHLLASFLTDNSSTAEIAILDWIREDRELVEDYATLALHRITKKQSKKAATSWEVSRWVFPPLWLNDRSRLVKNDYRSHPFYVNAHHAGLFNGSCGLVVDRIDRHGWIGRNDFSRFKNGFPRNYELLVAIGAARSLDDPATMTSDDRLWLLLQNAPLIYTLEVRPANDQIRAVSERLATQIAEGVREENVANSLQKGQVFTLGEWEQATKVFFGSRGDQVATIDRLLPFYHAYRRAGNQAAWIRIGCWIGEQAEEHLRTKPRSDRRKGMVQLAKQIYNALPAA